MYKLIITTTRKTTGEVLTHSEVSYPTYTETLNKSVLKNIYILEAE